MTNYSRMTRNYWTPARKRQVVFRIPALIVTLVAMIALTYLMCFTAISTLITEFDYMMSHQFVSPGLIIASIFVLIIVVLMWVLGVTYRRTILRDEQAFIEGLLWFVGIIESAIFSVLMFFFIWMYEKAGVQPRWFARLKRFIKRKIRKFRTV